MTINLIIKDVFQDRKMPSEPRGPRLKRSRGDDDAVACHANLAGVTGAADADGASSVADDESGGDSHSKGGASHKRGKVAGGRKPGYCETCCKVFARSDSLVKHMLTHTGEKPHVCETCGEAFSRSDNLTRHMRTHSGSM